MLTEIAEPAPLQEGAQVLAGEAATLFYANLFAADPEETWSSTDDDELLNDVLDMGDSESVTYEFTPV